MCSNFGPTNSAHYVHGLLRHSHMCTHCDTHVATPIWWPPLCAHIDGLMQERRNSSALAMELRLSFINPSIYIYIYICMYIYI